MANLTFFKRFFKRKTEGANSEERLSQTTANEASTHIAPIDYTKELLSNESKDRQLYKFYQFYKKQDFYDRFKFLAIFLLGLSYLLSLASCYLSYPFLDQFLQNDVPNIDVRFYAVVFLLVLNEIAKHLSLSTAFKTHFTYRARPYISMSIFLLAIGFSIYACVNGIKTSTEQAYQPPTKEQIVTQYDSEIADLRATNERIFERAKWKGKLNNSSKAGRTYADNESLIASLNKKATKEREQLYNKALTKYNQKHEHKASFRQYAGYGIETMILFCASFYLLYMFRASFEHTARIVNKFVTMTSNSASNFGTNSPPIAIAENRNKIGYGQQDNILNNGNNSNSDKQITNYTKEDLKALVKTNRTNYNSYKWKLKNNKGREENNREKMAFFKSEIERLTELQKQFDDPKNSPS